MSAEFLGFAVAYGLMLLVCLVAYLHDAKDGQR